MQRVRRPPGSRARLLEGSPCQGGEPAAAESSTHRGMRVSPGAAAYVTGPERRSGEKSVEDLVRRHECSQGWYGIARQSRAGQRGTRRLAYWRAKIPGTRWIPRSGSLLGWHGCSFRPRCGRGQPEEHDMFYQMHQVVLFFCSCTLISPFRSPEVQGGPHGGAYALMRPKCSQQFSNCSLA